MSDWPSISRESTMEDKRTGVEGGEGYAGLSSRPSECEDPSSELPDDVSALIKRALAQVTFLPWKSYFIINISEC